jgi:hypothetical protein
LDETKPQQGGRGAAMPPPHRWRWRRENEASERARSEPRGEVLPSARGRRKEDCYVA